MELLNQLWADLADYAERLERCRLAQMEDERRRIQDDARRLARV